MTDANIDAQLVAGHLAGDRAAFAAIYDRYGATLYDTAAAMTRDRHDAADITQDVFVAAAERMDQLRDPSRLKPWLFAILRNEVYRRSGTRKRSVPTDFTEPAAEMSVPTEPADDGLDLEYQELAELVRGASGGLDERDQLVLELSVRQGLQGDDLADALGVSSQQGYNLVHRMRQRTERSLGAYCVARKGRKDCTELARILDGWDGEFTILIRKRVARHIDGCDICERSRRTIAPLALFGAAPAFAAPPELRDRVLGAVSGGGAEPSYAFTAPGGFPTLPGAGRLLFWIVLSTLALLFVGGTTAFVLASDGDDGAVSVTADSTSTTVASTAPSSTDAPAAASATASTTAPSPTTTAAATTTTSTSSTTTTTSSSSTTSTSSTTTSTSSTTTSTTVAPPVAPAPPPPTSSTTTSTSTTTTTAPAPGSLSVSSGSVDLGATLDSDDVTLRNDGGQAVSWSVSSGPAAFQGGSTPFSVSPTGGTLDPGQSVSVTFAIDRAWPQEGPVPTRRFTFDASGTSAFVDVDAVVVRAPTVRVVLPNSTTCAFDSAGSPQPLVGQATVVDDSDVTSAVFVTTSPDGVRTSTPMTSSDGGTTWVAPVDPDRNGDGGPDAGTWTFSIEATDEFGATGSAAGTTVLVARSC